MGIDILEQITKQIRVFSFKEQGDKK